jgi:homoserine/homoserine lactone efflux protein
MSISVWLTYLVATIILSVTPGPGVFSSLSSGLNHGFRKGVWNAVGMQAANAILIGVVSLGLGAILLASETLFSILKWVGVAYLLYLGIATWRAPVRTFHEEKDDAHTAKDVFLKGFLVNITNPKAMIFYVAILPQFIDVDRAQALQYAILATTTLIVDLAIMAVYIAVAAKVLRVMRDPAQLRWMNRTLGGMFVAAGLALASLRRAMSAAI